MDETNPLSPLDPAYVKVLRIVATIVALVPLVGAAALEYARILPMGAVIIPVLILLCYFVFVIPARRYARWGYDAGADRLRIVRGYLFHHDTIVPFGRIQHIDVDQGPIERRYDLATLFVHTAGTHNSTVALPGLKHADALALREAIRAHIKLAQG
jgi:uncharacterized protein